MNEPQKLIEMQEKFEEIDDILMQFEDWLHGTDGNNCTKARRLLNELKEQCSLPLVVGSCSWDIVQDYDDEYYETDCGQTFCMTDGTLEENSHKYCQSCGKEIKLKESKSA